MLYGQEMHGALVRLGEHKPVLNRVVTSRVVLVTTSRVDLLMRFVCINKKGGSAPYIRQSLL